MEAKCVVQMDGKKTRLLKPKLTSAIDNNNAAIAATNRDNYNDFTFDHSYWSFEGAMDGLSGNVNGQHIVTQEEVYADLGTDVINCAFEGTNLLFSIFVFFYKRYTNIKECFLFVCLLNCTNFFIIIFISDIAISVGMCFFLPSMNVPTNNECYTVILKSCANIADRSCN